MPVLPLEKKQNCFESLHGKKKVTSQDYSLQKEQDYQEQDEGSLLIIRIQISHSLKDIFTL